MSAHDGRRPDHRRRHRRRACTSIAVDMGYRLARMSYSSIIRESEDFGCAICDHEGRQLCESTQSTPLQSGPIAGLPGRHRPALRGGRATSGGPATSSSTTTRTTARRISPTSRFVVPSSSATSSSASRSTTAHHLDLGALTPGHVRDRRRDRRLRRGPAAQRGQGRGGGPARSARLADPAPTTRALPDLVVGDLEAQVAAARARRRPHAASSCEPLRPGDGARRVRAPHGPLRADAAPRDRGAARRHVRGRAARSTASSTIPTRPTATCHRGRRDGRAARDLHVDLEGTAPQVDLPINMPLVGTVDIAILLTLRSLLLDSTRHEPVASNAGLFRPVTISAPRGDARQPALPGADDRALLPGQHRGGHGHARARARCCPDAVAAGVGNLKVTAFSGQRAGGAWVYMDIMEGSYGGRHGSDGLDAVDTLYANTRNNPIEDIESHYPLRVRRYELAEGGGGRGPLARRPGLDPRVRVPRGGRRSRSRATAARARRPGSSAAATGRPAR